MDADGGHINCLLVALFLYHVPQLIEAGKVYCAVPPLYRVSRGKEYHYLYHPDQLKDFKNYDITRYKGLGEQCPEELWESTMDPDTRELIQLTSDDMEEIAELYGILMGNSPAKRKSFIMQHARDYRLSNDESSDVMEGDE